MEKIGSFFRVKELRAGSFQYLGAFVGKGMPELDKLNIIQQSGYLVEVRDAMLDKLNNYEENFGDDEYDEEKSYMTAVSQSVNHMGKWCLSVQQPVGCETDPFKSPESRQYYDQVFNFLLEKAIYILDTDCMEVGWPMIDFLTPWVQSHYKMFDQLPAGVGEKILHIFEIVIKRIAFPEWCEIEIEPDDQ